MGKQVKAVKHAKNEKGEKHSGSAPAIIPWSEILEVHVSAIESHTRMLEMIQKYTVKGSDSWDALTAMLNRGREVLYQAKNTSRLFDSPMNRGRDGIYSESIECGECGHNWQASANDPEYKVNGHGSKYGPKDKDNLEDREVGMDLSEVGSTVQSEDGGKASKASQSNPLPIIPKRPLECAEREREKKRSKTERKMENEEERTQGVVIETEDIRAEVEAWLKAKEAKARSKEIKDKKRYRRESEDADADKIVKRLRRGRKA